MLESTWQLLLVAFFVFEWFLRFFMLYVVPRNRQPTSATSWLMLIMVFPTLGFLLYAMFGNPKLPKSRQRLQNEVDLLTQSEIKALEKSSPKLFEGPKSERLKGIERLVYSLGGLPSMNGSNASVIHDYDEMITEQARAIDSASEYVHLEYFILVQDKDTKIIFDSLKKAVEKGVKVRVLFDRFGSSIYPGHKKMLKYLDEIGVDWHPMLPLSLLPGNNYTRPDLRNHRKIVVVDGKVGFCSSANIITKNYHRKDNLIYEELAFRLTGPAVWQFNNVFRSDWYAETKEPLLDLVEEADMPKDTGNMMMQALPSGPSHPHANNLILYAGLFHAALKRISIVVPYFVPDESVMTAIKAAALRGVEVTIVNSEIIDKVMVGHAQRSYYDELLSVGVKIYLYKKPVFLHNKQVLIDDEVAVTGSSNLDIRSFELDLELSLVIYDKKIVSQLDEVESKYIKKSLQITPDIWDSRPFRRKLLERLSRLTSALQ